MAVTYMATMSPTLLSKNASRKPGMAAMCAGVSRLSAAHNASGAGIRRPRQTNPKIFFRFMVDDPFLWFSLANHFETPYRHRGGHLAGKVGSVADQRTQFVERLDLSLRIVHPAVGAFLPAWLQRTKQRIPGLAQP